MRIKQLIVIPARSGSKGITDKNIRTLNGKPLLLWAVDVVKKAKLENCLIILSTDSDKYAEIGSKAGLQVPFLRPVECAGDNVSAVQVAEHALQWFKNEYAYYPEQLMWLQPTSPFRSSSIIRQAIDMLDSQEVDSVITCKEIYRNLSTLFTCNDGYLQSLSNSDHGVHTNRQEIKPLLTPNGAMYLCETAVFLEKKTF